MRPIRYLLDLPWWTGLLIFLLGNAMVPYWYIGGLPICLFGAWTFSKLLPPVDHPEVGLAIIGFPLFFLAMLIPDQFAFQSALLDLLNAASPKVLFGIRAALGIGVGFLAFQGVRK
jgi:hypothetical protein